MIIDIIPTSPDVLEQNWCNNRELSDLIREINEFMIIYFIVHHLFAYT